MTQPYFLQRIAARLQAFRDDQDGNVTAEFVIMVPLLVMWGVGSFLYYDAYRSMSQTNKVGYTLADIASRYEQIEEDDIDELNSLATRMLPFRNTDHRLRVSSICYYDEEDEGNGTGHRIQWSQVRNPGEMDDGTGTMVPVLPVRDDANIPDEDFLPLMADQDTVIYVELYSTWWPLSTKMMPVSQKTWFVDLIIRPRFVREIPLVELDGDGEVLVSTPADPGGCSSEPPVT